MSPSIVRFALGASLASAMAIASGCLAPVAVGAAAGYGAFSYANGDLNGVAYANVDQTWRATLKAVDQLGLSVQDQRKEVTRGYLRAYQADKTEVRIAIERRSGDFTRINVRIGVFGDEHRSRAIIEQIKSNL